MPTKGGSSNKKPEGRYLINYVWFVVIRMLNKILIYEREGPMFILEEKTRITNRKGTRQRVPEPEVVNGTKRITAEGTRTAEDT